MNLRRVVALVTLLGGGCIGSILETARTPGADDDATAPGAPASSPGSPTSPPSAGPVACAGTTPARLWKLTPEQYTRTAQVLLGTKSQPGLELNQGLSREAGAAIVSPPHAAALYTVASRLADEAAATPKNLHPCLADRLSDPACVRQFISDFGGRAFRRDLVEAEVASYADFFQRQAAARDAATALRLVVRAMLLSPAFLFRFEVGPDGAGPGQPVRLTPFERASAISYFLTD